MDGHKTHKALVQMAERLEQASGHNECCSAPSPCWFPACNLCERHTFAKHIINLKMEKETIFSKPRALSRLTTKISPRGSESLLLTVLLLMRGDCKRFCS